jgi:hypothetical protein
VLDGLEDPLKALGAQSVQWLCGAGMAEAIRTGFNPASAAVLTTGAFDARDGACKNNGAAVVQQR